ncbi:hypothetical protein C8A00DRAFT_14844, partial [Chaetomidium leptoderma]
MSEGLERTDHFERLPWTDFNYDSLLSIFAPVVEQPWLHPPPRRGIDPMEVEIFDEKSVESHLTKYTMPLVNAALIQANGLLGHDDNHRGHIWATGRGGTTSGRPDWSVCSPDRKHQSGRYVNLVPGDTKVSKKWLPTLKRDNLAQWALPIRQVFSYSRDLKVRYGFIITDADLVVLRFRRFEIGPGSSQSRPMRAYLARARMLSTASDTSAISATSLARPPSSTGAQGSEYSDSQPTGEFAPPEYCTIPWSNYNTALDGKPSKRKSPVLTVRLALFYLCLLAGNSPDTSMGHDYPPLNSWTKTGAGYVHNSTGKKVTQPPENATVVDPRSNSSTRSDSA